MKENSNRLIDTWSGVFRERAGRGPRWLRAARAPRSALGTPATSAVQLQPYSLKTKKIHYITAVLLH